MLLAVLADGRRVDFPGLGHMGPVTEPQRVNEAIANFVNDGEIDPKVD